MPTGFVRSFYPKYGYGFMERVENGKRVVGHGGGFPGVCGVLIRHGGQRRCPPSTPHVMPASRTWLVCPRYPSAKSRASRSPRR